VSQAGWHVGEHALCLLKGTYVSRLAR
jgi:hypothetical protein